MSEHDEGKPKEFFLLRSRVLIANRKVKELDLQLASASAEADTLERTLQAICPHLDVTECPECVTYPDGPGFPAVTQAAQRRCEDCGLVHSAHVPFSPLFQRSIARYQPYREFIETFPLNS